MKPLRNCQSNSTLSLSGMLAMSSALLISSMLPAIAQTQDQVILRSEGEFEIIGTEIALEDGIYQIKTALGELLIAADEVECIGARCADLVSDRKGAKPIVTLLTKAGDMELNGRLIALEDGAYVLETALGELRVPAENMICVGDGCPEIALEPRFAIHADGAALENLLPSLLRDFAKMKGATLSYSEGETAGERVALMVDDGGKLVAEMTLRPETAEGSLRALDDGNFDVAFTPRRIAEDEVTAYKELGYGDLRGSQHETLVALDAVTVAIHPDNQVRNISPDMLKRVWAGDITNWQELGGRDMPIRLYGYSEAANETLIDFHSNILPGSLANAAPMHAKLGGTDELIEAIKLDRAAIGVAPKSAVVTGGARLISLTRSCGLIASPSNFDVKIGDYPAGREIYAYTRPNALHPVAREFVRWATSVAAQDTIAHAGFANGDIERTGIENMGMMLVHTAAVEPDFDGTQFSTMMRELRSADRLSIAFRFQSGSSLLDTESIANLGNLANRIRAGEFTGQEILLVGFADSIGEASQNTALAQTRARAVSDILQRELPNQLREQIRINSLSFGEQLPMACNDDPNGRELNRRVEVWTRLAGQDT
ncbi:phosphate ABC transporter substrate-binding/OmpA family protein [Yoonia maritima]|uniref:phosphate ABC transporter substrate-binding/OmpA family protein n=1 Tax=Yoonia maritima TaxID=1435347 RepID=UPI000D0EBE85|nr:phosphate ABC transporter substrate-binding/OmpA family protein [Yoonia maritima]